MRSFVRLCIYIGWCKIKYNVRFHNRQNVRKLDKCMICANHSNKDEPAWLYADNNHLCIMAKAELFNNKFMAFLYKCFGIFPIRRGEKDVKSIMHAINLFKNVKKRKLLIFPEGERLTKEEEKGEAKVGPAYIAAKAGIPIVPTYITKNVDKHSKVDIIYGTPINVPKEVIKDKQKLKEFSNKLLDTIYSLRNEYR